MVLLPTYAPESSSRNESEHSESLDNFLPATTTNAGDLQVAEEDGLDIAQNEAETAAQRIQAIQRGKSSRKAIEEGRVAPPVPDADGVARDLQSTLVLDESQPVG